MAIEKLVISHHSKKNSRQSIDFYDGNMCTAHTKCNLEETFTHVANHEYDASSFKNYAQLSKECARMITVRDTLEYIHDIPQFLQNCLELVTIGGIVDIKVPHLFTTTTSNRYYTNTFSEYIWHYYTDWLIPNAYQTTGFALHELTLIPSANGTELIQQGRTLDSIKHIPGAIDTIHVLLKKTQQQAYHQQASQSQNSENFTALMPKPKRCAVQMSML